MFEFLKRFFAIVEQFVATPIFPLLLLGSFLLIVRHLWKKITVDLVISHLNPFFSADQIKNAVNKSIPLKFQNVSPIFSGEIHPLKKPLIPFFLKYILNREFTREKFIMVLGTAGMGKTTFLINLFYRYFTTIKPNKNSITLLPFALSNIDQEIANIPNQRNTILLLDGFDEDLEAVTNPHKRLAQLTKLLYGFHRVIITSRIYLFSSENEELYETGLSLTGVQVGHFSLQTIYLSNADDVFIKKYLNIKYGRWKFWNLAKKNRIARLMNAIPDPALKVLILQYINDLERFAPSKYIFQTAAELIKIWIKRESQKLSLIESTVYKEKILDFTREVAKQVYNNRSEGRPYTATGKQVNDIIEKMGLQKEKLIFLNHSLLQRDPDGNWSFTHIIILEYFLALEIFNSKDFRSLFDIKQLPGAIRQYEEMTELYRKEFKGGEVLSVWEVFGISNKLVASYYEREDIDLKFKDAVRLDKHIIVYGSSKQGKTSLFKKHIADDKYLVINCSKNYELINIYKSILRQADVVLMESVSKENSVNNTTNLGFRAKFQIPTLSEVESKAGFSESSEKKEVLTFETVDFDIDKAQDIIEILKKIKFIKRIVLENFHYLSEDVQYNLAFDLRNFQDENILFIIIGIWRESNRLCQYNMDLLERIVEIPVEPWKKEDFVRVAEKGERLLQIKMNDILGQLIAASFDSIGVFQELCKESYLHAISEKGANKDNIVLTEKNLTAAIEKKISDYTNSHIRSFEAFSHISEEFANIPFLFIKTLLLLDYMKIEKGIDREYLKEKILSYLQEQNNVSIDGEKIKMFIKSIKEYQLNNMSITAILGQSKRRI